jgi:hypothetical protein
LPIDKRIADETEIVRMAVAVARRYDGSPES